MAVASGNTEVKTVLEISTGNSPKSIRELRQQIKDLRDELVGLDKGSQEYADTLAVLGNKTNDLKELMGDISRTNSDFGTTLSNVSNVMAGGVAAVQGLTAGLSLLGVNLGNDDKLTQTLVKSMALLQSLGTMDKAIKSFKALSVLIKSNIAAAGGLGKALKALAVSNPFTAILAAVVAVGAAVAKVTSLINEQRDAQAKLNMEYSNGAMLNAYDELAVKLNNQTELMKINGSTDYEVFLQKKENAKQLRDEAQKNLFYYQKLSMEGNKHERKAAEEYVKTWTDAYNERQKAYTDLINSTPVEQARADKAAKDAEEKRKKDAQNAAKARLDAQYKAEQDNYNHLLSLQKQAYNQQLAEAERVYQNQLELANGNAEAIEAAERQKASAVFRIEQDNYLKMIELAENYRKLVEARPNTDGSQTAQLDSLNETVLNLTTSLDGCADAYRQLVREQEAARKEKELTKQQIESEIATLDKETERLTRNSAMQNTFNQETIDYLNKVNDAWGPLAGSISAYYEVQRTYQQQLLELEQEHSDLLEDRDNLDARLEQIKSQYEQGLITVEEYEKQKAEIRQQYAEVQAQIDNNEVEQERVKLEKKKQLNEAYCSAINNITGDLVGLLNTMADAEGVSFEESKKMKIAAATISTIQGGINAFMGYLDSGIPQPYASILGAAAAAATVAMGISEIQKIKATKPGISASASSGAVQVVTAPPQIVNLNQENLDNITMPDTRVYVLESDITEAQNHVQVVESNSTF